MSVKVDGVEYKNANEALAAMAQQLKEQARINAELQGKLASAGTTAADRPLKVEKAIYSTDEKWKTPAELRGKPKGSFKITGSACPFGVVLEASQWFYLLDNQEEITKWVEEHRKELDAELTFAKEVKARAKGR